MSEVAARSYLDLVERGASAAAHPFDTHVAASILAISIAEAARSGQSLGQCCGLGQDALDHLGDLLFAGHLLHAGCEPARNMAEQDLFDLLWMYSGSASPLQRHFAIMIARRSQRPNHLWQDLGLANRGELSLLMERHFPRLAQKNSADMKWKKFFQRMTCSSEGFRLCAAPVCDECDDFETCFGDEDGESLMARVANRRIVPDGLRA